jgi:hypothetical protein
MNPGIEPTELDMQTKNRVVAAQLIMMMVLLTSAASLQAADENPAYTDPAQAGADFKIQGEYEGITDADGARWGAQVVALGDGNFRIVGYQGGLPGSGFQPGNEIHTTDGELENGVAVFEAEHFLARADGQTLKIETTDGEEVGTLKRVERTSPTLGQKPPEGAVVLFDGTNVDQWNNGRLTDEHCLAATGTDTKKSLADHRLHLEFRTPFMPKSRGQARGNSGVYVQSRYEVQVLDSFGLTPRDNECGGIYSIAEPKVNMCFPPLSWQTYDIDFQAARFDDRGNKTENARITVRLNGVVIHNDIELPHATPGRLTKETPEAAPLFLQDHGNPVAFRNIWVVEK